MVDHWTSENALTKQALHSLSRLEAASEEAVRLASLRSYIQKGKICASDSMAALVYQKAMNVVSPVVRREF
jgi:hypothetical protein